MAWNLDAIEHRVDGVGRPKFDFHAGQCVCQCASGSISYHQWSDPPQVHNSPRSDWARITVSLIAAS